MGVCGKSVIFQVRIGFLTSSTDVICTSNYAIVILTFYSVISNLSLLYIIRESPLLHCGSWSQSRPASHVISRRFALKTHTNSRVCILFLQLSWYIQINASTKQGTFSSFKFQRLLLFGVHWCFFIYMSQFCDERNQDTECFSGSKILVLVLSKSLYFIVLIYSQKL